MRENLQKSLGLGILGGLVALTMLASAHSQAGQTFLNVSYDPTRELYKAINPAFAADWKARTGETIEIQASHGGSGAQARGDRGSER